MPKTIHHAQTLGAAPQTATTPRAVWRNLAVFIIKLVHTLIFGVVSSCVLHVFWAGVRGRPTRWTGPATAIVLTEGAVFFGNRWHCPLTQLAEEMGAESGQVTDIFLPKWFADRIPQIYTPPFIIGVIALRWHFWRQRMRRRT